MPGLKADLAGWVGTGEKGKFQLPEVRYSIRRRYRSWAPNNLLLGLASRNMSTVTSAWPHFFDLWGAPRTPASGGRGFNGEAFISSVIHVVAMVTATEGADEHRPLPRESPKETFDMHDDTNESDEVGAKDDGGGPPLEQTEPASVSKSQADTAIMVEAKLEQIQELCGIGDFDRARPLLYDVLTEGDASQVEVAKGILAQLDA